MEYYILAHKVPVFSSVLQNSCYVRPAESLLLPSVLHNPSYFLLSCRMSITCFYRLECLLLLLSFRMSFVCLCLTEAPLFLSGRLRVNSVL